MIDGNESQRTMIKAERFERILDELAKRGVVGVPELATMLCVSEATIRRDLTELDEKGLAQRTHGGGTLRSGDDELPYPYKTTAYLAEKRRIAAKVASLIRPHQVVGCTGGTTVTQVARALRGKPIRLVTNAVNLALELAGAPEIEVLLTGGLFRGRSYELSGHVAERTLQDVHLDVAIIGVDGLSPHYGLSTYNHAEAQVCRVLIERASEVWAVADHGKLGQVRPAIIAPLGCVHKLITDTGVSAQLAHELSAAGLEVITV